jgi:hypothetical protein
MREVSRGVSLNRTEMRGRSRGVEFEDAQAARETGIEGKTVF